MLRNYPGTDFQLPGLAQDSTLEYRLITVIVGAYSTAHNPRLLEHPFYGVWNIILTAIISDLGPHAYIVPQFTLDGLAPIHDLASSITEANANERIPDFAIIADDFDHQQLYAHANILNWDTISTLSRRCLILVEGKRPPTRRPQNQTDFEDALDKYLVEAHSDLKKQAAKVFEAHVDVERLMLVSFSGVWWDWMIYTRQHHEQVATTNTLDQPMFSSSESEESSGSEYVPIEEETEAEDEVVVKREKQKKAEKPAQSRGPLPSSSQPGNPAPVTVANSDSDSIDESGSNTMIDQSQPPAATVQGEGGIEPSGATQLRRSNRIRQTPKRYEVPLDRPLPVQRVKEPQRQVPATESPTQYHHNLKIMEPLHKDVDKAVRHRTGTVSKPILLGSSVSNQALYIIHNWLEKEIKKFLGRRENEGEDGDAGESEGEDDAGESEGEDDAGEREAEPEEEWSDLEYE